MAYPKDAKERRLMIREDIKTISQAEQGRRFLWWVLHKQCLMFDSVFTGNSQTFYKAGRRDVGRELREIWLDASMETLHLAEKENWQQEETERINKHGRSGNDNGHGDE